MVDQPSDMAALIRRHRIEVDVIWQRHLRECRGHDEDIAKWRREHAPSAVKAPSGRQGAPFP
jgi:hypothetical protein